jgi:hypothetical protein
MGLELGTKIVEENTNHIVAIEGYHIDAAPKILFFNKAEHTFIMAEVSVLSGGMALIAYMQCE